MRDEENTNAAVVSLEGDNPTSRGEEPPHCRTLSMNALDNIFGAKEGIFDLKLEDLYSVPSSLR